METEHELEHTLEQYEPMMYSILKKHHLYNRREDYIDLCYLGFCKALKTHDASKSTFGNYVYRCMNNEVQKQLRHETANKRLTNDISYEWCIDTKNDLKPLYEAENDKIERVRELNEQQLLVEIGLEALDDRERHVISHLFKLTDNNLSREELALHWGISPTHITNIKNKALAKMKRSLEEWNLK